jgi:lactonase family protein with 7-bladed beta-propeller
MRKSRFLLSLIAATAIGLSVFGCDSADSGSIGDTTDLIAANDSSAQTQSLREYLVVGERGYLVSPISTEFLATQTAPAAAPGEVIAVGSGDAVSRQALLYEIFGINNVPLPNFNLTTPGGAGTDPNMPEVGEEFGNAGSAGYHGVYVDPTNKYVIGVSRSLNRGTALEPNSDVTNAQMQIFSFQPAAPFDQQFPPDIGFGGVLDPTPIQIFPPNQGLFVSGAWSNDAKNFYLGINEGVRAYAIDGNSGQLGQPVQVLPFGAGGTAVNNPVKLIVPPSDAFVYAIDNANNQITRYARGDDGTLTLLGQTPTVADPRGATVDRTGTYMYVIGRSSALLAAYRIEASGELTPIEPFAGLGAVPAPLGAPLGDVDANPINDRIFVGTYAGVLQGYNIDLATGTLSPAGAAGSLLAGSRNIANVEVDPTGQFVVTAQEHDFTELQSFVTNANGFAVPEDPIFANLIAPNTEASEVYSLVPQTDANGNTVFALPQPSGNAFEGDIEGWRINSDGSVRAIVADAAVNPYGIDFYQLVVTPPVPNNSDVGDVAGTGPDAAPDPPTP